MNRSLQLTALQTVWPVALAATLLTPFVTFLLLAMKGFPNFASDRPLVILLWCYETTGVVGLLSGLFLSGLALLGRSRWGWIIWPYDFGRAVSVGAIGGSAAQVLATLLFRWISGRPFSPFWLSGAVISGAICGAIIAAVYFYRRSKDPIVP